MIYLLLCIAVAAAWSPPGYAVQPGAGSGNLNTQGEQEGVAMTVGPGTLTVGTQDIFTNNAALLLPGTAVFTDANATHSTRQPASVVMLVLCSPGTCQRR